MKTNNNHLPSLSLATGAGWLATGVALVVTPILSILMFLPLGMLWAWVWTIGYDQVLVPMVQEYFQYALPVIPWAFWVAIYVLITMMKGTFGIPRNRTAKDDDNQVLENTNQYISKIGTALCFALLLAVIGWWFV